ncbi:hypothetical protein VHEMI02706 [[Torrubiella] hemipterigena]|uniref:SWI5-dependent HO expression protein 3 n=1 Tax=[Torrubiella] hemipterigena TaxID=1531966 RepID=A0A0A1T8S5_9HYPO|nr:hypothetical protein VHEMI02706 [[Torrubiella] hemipterigena]
MPRNRLQKQFPILADKAQVSVTTRPQLLDDSFLTPLTPVSTAFINSMQAHSPQSTPKVALGRTATIRSVRSFDASDSSPDSKQSSGTIASTNSSTSIGSVGPATHNIDRTDSPTKSKSDTMPDGPNRWSASSIRVIEPQGDSNVLTEAADADGNQWDSTIGKAGLGKTGRVINRLVSENDALKREIQIERLRAEEAKQAAKLIEDKMERMMNEYEGKLLEANVTKTLLGRKERQVDSLTAALDAEKKKSQAALESERTWLDELNRVKKDSKIQVDKATTQATLMEGRYNAISSHWRDQGDQVKRAMTKMRGEIAKITEERSGDDDKIRTLRDLCEQQDSNIKELRREKDEISRLFSEYKETQEKELHHIKTNGRETEAEQTRLLADAKETLDKLRWALNVKNNVAGAQ